MDIDPTSRNNGETWGTPLSRTFPPFENREGWGSLAPAFIFSNMIVCSDNPTYPELRTANLPFSLRSGNIPHLSKRNEFRSAIRSNLQKFIGDEPMRRITALTYFASLFLSIFVLACTPLHAQAGMQSYSTICRYQGVQDGHQVVYVTPVIHTNLAASDISAAFNRYMSGNYDISKIQGGSGYCSTKVSNSADQQAYTMQQLEKNSGPPARP